MSTYCSLLCAVVVRVRVVRVGVCSCVCACDCAGNTLDCAGVCGGGSVVDECGECGGDGIDDGACDCDGNTLDCSVFLLRCDASDFHSLLLQFGWISGYLLNGSKLN